jgi:outer membrane lipoprotein SlyB
VVEQAAAPPPPPPKPVCATCGKVEAVTPIQVKGEGSGVGAVAGAVVGGVLGHQMGGGRGKTAMTVIGAGAGGLAGNEVEKRHNASTNYELRIRMDDGSTRTITQSQQLMVGQRVTVEGDRVTLAP